MLSETAAASSPSQEASSALKLIVKGAGFSILGLAFSKVAAYLFRLIVARLGPDQYGVFAAGFSFFDIAVTLASLGIFWGVLRYVPEYSAKGQLAKVNSVLGTAFIFSAGAGVVAAAALFLSAGIVALQVFHDARVASVIAVLALAVPFYNLESVAVAACRAFKRIDYEVLVKHVAENALKLAFAALAIYLGFHFFGMIVAFAAAIVVSTIISLLVLHTRVHGIGRSLLVYDRRITSSLLRYSLPIMLSNSVWLLVAWSDTLFLGYFRSIEEVGIYNTALPTAGLLLVVPAALGVAFQPITFELLARKKREDFKRVYSVLTKWLFLFNLPVLAMFWTFPSQIITLLFGPEYAGAGIALALLSIGHFVSSLLNLGDTVMGAFNKTKWQFHNSALVAAVSLSLNLLLVPQFGVVGAAAAACASLVLYGVLSFYRSYSLLGFHPLSASLAKITACAAVAAFVAKVLSGLDLVSGVAWYLSVFAVYALLYCALVFSWAVDDDDRLVYDAAKKRLKSVFPAR